MSVTSADPATCRYLSAGAWRESRSRDGLPVHNPATGEVIARVPFCTSEEIEATVRAADDAWRSWRQVPAVVRARYLFRYRDLLERHKDELARLITREHGKTLDDARGSIQRGIEVVEFACGIPTLMMGETLDEVAPGIDTHTYRAPIGVCLGVTPYNFPAMVPLWMLPLAVACGNSFILKPSEKVPHTANRLVELLVETGLPPGVVSVVHGAGPQVEALVDHPLVRAVSIVGSSGAAAAVYARAAARGKRVQALGGAKNHMVVMPDADLDTAVEAIVGSAFGSAGQRCMAGAVAVAVEPVGDELVRRVVARGGALRMGPGDADGCELGPLVSEALRARVAGYLEIGKAEGATIALDGRRAATGPGFFLGASVVDHVRPGSRVATEEIFGPVLALVRVADLDAALAVVNQSALGNAGVIFTRDGGAARRFARGCEAGMIGVNVGVPVPMAFFPFAGWKGSFFGDLHAHGKDGVRFYTEHKVVTSRFPV